MIKGVKAIDAITFAYPDPNCHAMYNPFETNHGATHAANNPASQAYLHSCYNCPLVLRYLSSTPIPNPQPIPLSVLCDIHPPSNMWSSHGGRSPPGTSQMLVTAADGGVRTSCRVHWEVALASLVWSHPGDVHFFQDHSPLPSYISHHCNGQNGLKDF